MDTREIVQDEPSISCSRALRQTSLCRSKRAVANLSRRHLVDVAPHPCFARFNRADKRVLGLMEVLSGVFVLRRVTAAYMAAFETKAQVNPGIARLHALFANVLVSLRHVNFIRMFALHIFAFPSLMR